MFKRKAGTVARAASPTSTRGQYHSILHDDAHLSYETLGCCVMKCGGVSHVGATGFTNPGLPRVETNV